MKRPPALKHGDLIGIAAPSSGFPRDAFEAGIHWLEAQGFRPFFREDLFARDHYLAGSRERRLDELHGLFAHPEVKAIFFARGGYGLMHLLPHLRLEELGRRPRILLGHSDLTPLLNLLPQRLEQLAFHGPLVAGIHKTAPETLERLLAMLTSPLEVPDPLTGPDVQALYPGKVRAPLCGGTLTLVASTLGTPWELDTRGRILCLEDVGERPYRLDRLLTQLELAGKLRQAAGFALGEFVDCEEPGGRGRPLLSLFAEHLRPFKVPVLLNLPFGHGPLNHPLPLGAEAVLDADRGALTLLHPAVS